MTGDERRLPPWPLPPCERHVFASSHLAEVAAEREREQAEAERLAAEPARRAAERQAQLDGAVAFALGIGSTRGRADG